jgi:hypothetical protein
MLPARFAIVSTVKFDGLALAKIISFQLTPVFSRRERSLEETPRDTKDGSVQEVAIHELSSLG